MEIVPKDLLIKCLFLVPTTLCSTGLEFLVPKEGMFLSGYSTMILLTWKLRWPPGDFGILMPMKNEQNADFCTG